MKRRETRSVAGQSRAVDDALASIDGLNDSPRMTATDYHYGLRDGRWISVRGVWRWAPERKRRKRAMCGTDGGYYRHLRRTKTQPCKACRRAHAEAERERSERARRAVA